MRIPMLRKAGWLLATLALGLAGCTTTVRMHADFPKRKAAIHWIAILPPDVKIMKKTFKGDDSEMTEETDELRMKLPTLIAEELRRQGFEVKETSVFDQEFAEDPDLRFEATLIQEEFARAEEELYERERLRTGEARRTERSIGRKVGVFSDIAESDALVVVRMRGFKKSGGEMAKDLLMAVATGVRVPEKGATLRERQHPVPGRQTML